MTKKQWFVAVLILLGIFILFDYADYNTEVRMASMAYNVSEADFKAYSPYIPFTDFNPLPYLLTR